MVTGQIVLRDSSESTKTLNDGSNRKLMMVVGVIAIPQDMPLKGEHKYTIASFPKKRDIESLYQMVDPSFKFKKEEFEEIEFVLFPETEENLTAETTGQSIGGIITSHHRWRI
jgi:hypothetical protein